MFIYWTFLGVFDALVFFFGAYFMFENTTVTSNGQVSAEPHLAGCWGLRRARVSVAVGFLAFGHPSTKSLQGCGTSGHAGLCGALPLWEAPSEIRPSVICTSH